MSQYRNRNRSRSAYRTGSRDPYKVLARDLYRRLLNRYRPTRPSGRDRGNTPRSAYRSNAERYRPSAEYKAQPQQRSRSEVIVRREPSRRIEFPAYKPEPDVEQLLKQLEKGFDERLHERILELMEKEFQENWRDMLERYGLPEDASDEDVRMKIERLQDPEKWEEQKKEHFVEVTEDMVEDEQEAKQAERKQHEALENTAETKAIDEPPIEKQDAGSREIWMTRAELEAIENAPARVTEKIDDGLYEIVETESVESSHEPQAQAIEQANGQNEESNSIEQAELQNAPELVDTLAENLPEPVTELASAETAEPIGAELLEDPLLVADIELLYDELEAEEFESEEEQIEPGY